MEEHLFQPIISDMVIDQIQYPQSLRKIFGDVEQQIVVYFAAVQLQMHQIRKGLQETGQHPLLHLSEVVLEDLDRRVKTAAV